MKNKEIDLFAIPEAMKILLEQQFGIPEGMKFLLEAPFALPLCMKCLLEGLFAMPLCMKNFVALPLYTHNSMKITIDMLNLKHFMRKL